MAEVPMKLWLIIILITAVLLVVLSLPRASQTLEVESLRIVSLSPAITEILFELGLGRQIVGVSEYSDYPPEAQKIPPVAKYGDPNIELILLAKPDLVIGQKVSAEKNKLLQNKIGPNCEVLILKTDTLAEIIETTDIIAMAAGVVQRGQELTGRWRRKMDELRSHHKNLAEEDRPRVYVEVGQSPLRTCGPGTYLSEMIRLAGGRNLGDAANSLWPVISSETVVAWNPQVILVSGMERSADFKKQISSRLGWEDIEAVKSGRIVALGDEYARQGPRVFAASERLVQIIRETTGGSGTE